MIHTGRSCVLQERSKYGCDAMTDKELRRLNRRELLEMLIEQGKKIDQLQAQLDEANEKLESRRIQLASAGSIAEAALKLNHIFEDAQAAADQYLENLGIGYETRAYTEEPAQAAPRAEPYAAPQAKPRTVPRATPVIEPRRRPEPEPRVVPPEDTQDDWEALLARTRLESQQQMQEFRERMQRLLQPQSEV